MEIKIEDYLSDSELKDIVKDAVKSHIKNLIGDKEYSFTQKLAKDLAKNGVEELIPNFKNLLNSHIETQIKSLTLGDLFFNSFGWRSEGNKLFTKILSNNEKLIEKRIKEIFNTESTLQ